MAELLNAFNRAGKVVKKQERHALLKEIQSFAAKHGDAHLAVACVQLLLQNKDGHVYVVERGNKPENPYMFDKTVEGHVRSTESFDHALRRECKEELGMKIRIVTKKDFKKALQRVNTKRIAVVTPLKLETWHKSLRQDKKGSVWVKRIRLMRYIGRYDGPVRFQDHEARALRLLSRQELRAQLKKHPKRFTYDLHALLKA